MIDTEKMHYSISKIRHIFGDDVRATQSLGEVLELITRLREAEKDAERYRWLRESASLENHGGFEYDLPLIHAIRYMDGAELNQEMTFDEAIDQAMKEKGNE